MKIYSLLICLVFIVSCGQEEKKQEVNTAIDENNPENAANLKAYLQRESMHDTSTADLIVTNDLSKLDDFIKDTIPYLEVDSCPGCKTIDPKQSFAAVGRLKKNTLGYVRVRKSATCFEPAINTDVAGILPHDRPIHIAGPVKNTGGIAYLVLVIDKKGHRYKGYISATCFQ